MRVLTVNHRLHALLGNDWWSMVVSMYHVTFNLDRFPKWSNLSHTWIEHWWFALQCFQLRMNEKRMYCEVSTLVHIFFTWKSSTYIILSHTSVVKSLTLIWRVCIRKMIVWCSAVLYLVGILWSRYFHKIKTKWTSA